MLEGTHFEEFESEPCPVGACNKYEKYLEVSIRDQQMYSERFQDQDVLLTLTSFTFFPKDVVLKLNSVGHMLELDNI